MPVDKPVVVVAETTSKAISLRVILEEPTSQIETKSIPKNIVKRYTFKITRASRTTILEIVLLKIIVSFLSIDAECRVAIITARVVTLIPPAVEPGAPPINIISIVQTRVASERLFVGIVQKPALRDTIAWNPLAIILPDSVSSAKAPLRSNRYVIMKVDRIIIAVIISTTRAWRDKRRRFNGFFSLKFNEEMLLRTTNPNPPTVAIIINTAWNP